MSILFLFLDGIGLGKNDPEINPLASVVMPALEALLSGNKLIADSAPFIGPNATLLPLDAVLGVEGLPQSATGQASLVTGKNVPRSIGVHYGPKPNPPIADILREDTLFHRVNAAGGSAALLNAYPPQYFEAIQSGRRLYSSIPLAVTNSGLSLFTVEDLKAGNAMSADFTSAGWREHLGFEKIPTLSPTQAGQRLVELTRKVDLAFFEFWLSDYIGHRQDMSNARALLETIDEVLAGLVEEWMDADGLVVLTSDHGNMEDLSTRRHTGNPVPALLIGNAELRSEFSHGLRTIADITPAILRALNIP